VDIVAEVEKKNPRKTRQKKYDDLGYPTRKINPPESRQALQFEKLFCTPQEFSQATGLKLSRITRLIKIGELLVYDLRGNTYLIPLTELARIQAHQAGRRAREEMKKALYKRRRADLWREVRRWKPEKIEQGLQTVVKTDRDRNMFRRVVQEGETLQEVGETMGGLTRERVRKIVLRILVELVIWGGKVPPA